VSEYRLKIGERGPVDQKFHVERSSPTNHSSSHKIRVNGLSCGIRMRAQLSFVLSQITHLTDTQTEFSSLDRVCIPCSAVIKFYNMCNSNYTDNSTVVWLNYAMIAVK